MLSTKTKFFLNLREAQRFIEQIEESISETTYMRGINELIKKDFIAESPRGSGWFYINPDIIFNGDRVRFIQELVTTEAFKEAQKGFKKIKKKYLRKSKEELQQYTEQRDLPF